MMTRRLPLIAVLLALLASACGASEGAPSTGVFENLAARHDATSRGGGLYDSPRGAMPQVRYIIDGGEPVSVADAYVVGDFVRAEAGASFRWTEDAEEETRHALEFNAEDAQVSTVHVTVEIGRSIVDPNLARSVHDEFRAGNTVTFGLALDAPVDVAALEAEFNQAGTLAALLYRPSPVFDYEEGLWAVLEDGAYLGDVDDDVVEFRALAERGVEDSSGGDDHGGGDHASVATFKVSELEEPQQGGPKEVTYDAGTGTYHPVG